MAMNLTGKAALGAALILGGIGIAGVPATAEPGRGAAMMGLASWYGGRFHGRPTANGERFDMDRLTAAHRSLPFGSKVRITNRENNAAVVVRINDRGPFAGGRIIDLSRAAARQVRMLATGVAPVRIEVLSRGGG